MRNLSKKKFYAEKKFYSIYALFNKVEKNFFIGYCSSDRIINEYRIHYAEQNSKTKTWMKNIKNRNERPCIFIFEHSFSTKPEMFSHLIVWLKIIMENKFTPINYGSILDYANDLSEKNLKYYKEKNKIDLANFLNCNHCIFPKYKNMICEKYPLKGDITNGR